MTLVNQGNHCGSKECVNASGNGCGCQCAECSAEFIEVRTMTFQQDRRHNMRPCPICSQQPYIEPFV